MHQDALGSLQSFYVGIVHNVGAIYIYILGNTRGFRVFPCLGFSLPSENERFLESTHRKDRAHCLWTPAFVFLDQNIACSLDSPMVLEIRGLFSSPYYIHIDYPKLLGSPQKYG